MPITHEPKPLPSPLDYVPNQSASYRVTSGDSWWTLAEQPQVRAVAMSALDLCYFNFKTRRPPEINWYLRNKGRVSNRDERWKELHVLGQ